MTPVHKMTANFTRQIKWRGTIHITDPVVARNISYYMSALMFQINYRPFSYPARITLFSPSFPCAFRFADITWSNWIHDITLKKLVYFIKMSLKAGVRVHLTNHFKVRLKELEHWKQNFGTKMMFASTYQSQNAYLSSSNFCKNKVDQS